MHHKLEVDHMFALWDESLHRSKLSAKDSGKSQSPKKDLKGKDVPPPKQQKLGKRFRENWQERKNVWGWWTQKWAGRAEALCRGAWEISMALFGACDPTEFVFEILEVRTVNETPSMSKLSAKSFWAFRVLRANLQTSGWVKFFRGCFFEYQNGAP